MHLIFTAFYTMCNSHLLLWNEIKLETNSLIKNLPFFFFFCKAWRMREFRVKPKSPRLGCLCNFWWDARRSAIFHIQICLPCQLLCLETRKTKQDLFTPHNWVGSNGRCFRHMVCTNPVPLQRWHRAKRNLKIWNAWKNTKRSGLYGITWLL